jgi:hypothetical protein
MNTNPIFVSTIKKNNMSNLTNQFLREQKVNGNFQRIVMYCGTEHFISNVTDKNIMLKQCSKESRGNCGRFNSGRFRIANDENATEWYFNNRVIK